MAYPPAGLTTTWGASTDASTRATRLAGITNDLMAAVDSIVAELGANPSGAFTTVEDRLNAVAANAQYFRQPVRAATVTGISYALATSFENGDVLDGVTLATGDRILVKDIALGGHIDHGVYTVNASGAPTRATDYDTGSEFPGTAVSVLSGTVNAGAVWKCRTASVTLGSTSIDFINVMLRPPHYLISAVNNPVGIGNADFVCDGIADESQLTIAQFFLTFAPIKAATIELSAGDFTFGGAYPPLTGLTIVGAGRYATTIKRSANVVAFDLIGSWTGGGSSAGHKAGIVLRDLRFNGAVAPSTSPAVRVYYGNNHSFENVDWVGVGSIGLVAVEFYDSRFINCRWISVGSSALGPRTFSGTGTGSGGGRPALLILGDTATSAGSGFGHTDVQCNNLRFDSCVWESCVDGAILVHGNGSGEDFGGQVASSPGKLWFEKCKIESLFTGYAPQARFYRASLSWFHNCHLVAGNYFDGGGAPENVLDWDLCAAWSIFGLWIESQGSSVHRCYVRFNGCEAMDVYPIRGDDSSTVSPSVAIIDISGTTQFWLRQPRLQLRSRNAHTPTLINGTVGSCAESRGTATIPAASTSVIVAHGLSHTPTAADIMLCAAGAATSPPGLLWADTFTSSSMTIHCAAAPGAGGLVVNWWGGFFADAGHL